MRLYSLLLPTLVVVAGLAACDKRAPTNAPMVPPATSNVPASATPSGAMPPASSGSAP